MYDATADDAFDASDSRVRRFLAALPGRRGVWLDQLADVCRRTGFPVVEVPGWQTRSRSSGGYATLPVGVMWHHTASPPSMSEQRCVELLCTGPTAPVSAVSVGRSGTIWVVAAGATNHGGRGGPYPPGPEAWVGQDRANTTMLGVELQHSGDGVETWPQAQLDATLALAVAVEREWGFGIGRHIAHKEYCGPGTSTPGRKIDPLGDWVPAGSGDWGARQGRIDVFRARLAVALSPPPFPPVELPAEPLPPIEESDMLYYLTSPRPGVSPDLIWTAGKVYGIASAADAGVFLAAGALRLTVTADQYDEIVAKSA